MRKLMLAALVVMLVSATALASPIVYPIGQASTVTFDHGVGVGQTPRGWDFTVTQAISVVQLGVNAGVDIPITMSLWDVTTQTLLAQTIVASEAFTWEFADLTSPVTLLPGHTFSVIGWADTGTPWYIYSNNPPPAFNPTGVVEYLNTRYDNGIGPNVFPVGVLGAPAQYGVVDIGYLSGVPEPGTLLLLGSSALGLAGVIRRKLF